MYSQFPYMNNFPVSPYDHYLPSAYDNSMSIYQQVTRLIEHVNNLTKLTNETVKYLNEFIRTFDEKLYGTLSDVLSQWEKDGKLQEIVGNALVGVKNVRQYGAKGDGISDDHDAIQKMLDLKGQMMITKGKYRITKRLYIGSDTTLIVHPDAEIWLDGDDYCIIQNGRPEDCFSGYNGNGNITIDGGIWNCGGKVDVSSLRGGIFLGHGYDITIKNASFKNVYMTHHIEINSSKNVLIDNCKFTDFLGVRPFSEAIQIDGAVNQENFPPFGTWDGTLCNGVTVNNCYFSNVASGVGTHVAQNGKWHENINIINNKFEDLQAHAVHLFNMKEVNIENNNIKRAGVAIYFEGSYDNTVKNNTIKDTTGSAIQFANSSFNRVGDNTIGRASNGVTQYSGSKQNYYIGNRITGCTANGINFTGGENDHVENNALIGNAGHGLYLHDTVKNVIVQGNEIKDNTLSGINMQTTTYTKVLNNDIQGNGKNGSNSNINLFSGSDNNLISRNILRKVGVTKFNIAIDGGAGQNNELNMNDDEQGNAFGNKAIVITLDKLPLELKNDWTPFNENIKLTYQQDGNQVVLSGIIKVGKTGSSDSDDVMVAQLPTLARPLQAQFSIVSGIGASGTDFARVTVFPSGRIVVPSVGNITAVDFSNIKLVIR